MRTKKTKSPADRLKEAQEKVERLKLSTAKTEAAKNPQLSAINQILAGLNKDKARISRAKATFDYRINSNELHRNAIVAERDFTIVEELDVIARIEYLNSQITGIVTRLANNETVTEDEINQIILSMPCNPQLKTLEDAMNGAHLFWRDYIRENKNKAQADESLEEVVKGMTTGS